MKDAIKVAILVVGALVAAWSVWSMSNNQDLRIEQLKQQRDQWRSEAVRCAESKSKAAVMPGEGKN